MSKKRFSRSDFTESEYKLLRTVIARRWWAANREKRQIQTDRTTAITCGLDLDQIKTSGLNRRDQSDVIRAQHRKLVRSCHLCESAAKLWLIQRGYRMGSPRANNPFGFKYGAPKVKNLV